MMKKWLTLLALAVTVSGMSLAQDDGRQANPIFRSVNLVTSVELVQNDDNAELVIKGDLPDGCEIETTVHTEQVGEAYFVDLYREMPMGVMCPAILRSYEERLDISEALAAETALKIIVINGKIYGVDTETQSPQTVLTDLWAKGPLPYTDITLQHTESGEMSITLAGTLTDGCAIPVYRAVPDWQNEGFTNVEAFTAISLNAACAQVMTPFEATFTTPMFESLAINGVSVPYDSTLNTDTQVFQEQPLTITSAKAEWVEGILPNIKITVTGVTDGCEFPLQLVPQSPVDNTYVVKAVRVVPAETVCTMIARDFTQEVMLAPATADTPITIYIGDQTITLGD